MRNEHTTSNLILDSLRLQLAKGSAFKKAHAPSEEITCNLELSHTVGALSIKLLSHFWHDCLFLADWKMGQVGNSDVPIFVFHSLQPLLKKTFCFAIFLVGVKKSLFFVMHVYWKDLLVEPLQRLNRLLSLLALLVTYTVSKTNLQIMMYSR